MSVRWEGAQAGEQLQLFHVPAAATLGRLCGRRGGRTAAGSRLLLARGSCSAGRPTAATARPGPTRDPRLRTAAVCTHQHVTAVRKESCERHRDKV